MTLEHQNFSLKDQVKKLAEAKRCRCLGIYGLSSFSKEKDIVKAFEQFGTLERVTILRDRCTG